MPPQKNHDPNRPATYRTDPGSGYLKEVIQREKETDPDFRGHCYIPEDHALLGELQQQLGVDAGLKAFRLITGRKMSIYGWLKNNQAQGKPDGVAITVRAWKEQMQ